ncbi:molybdopterin-dependent oxidoreductase [Syntrophobacteraceae bacterium DRH4]|nr:molybdopterin-dependent oxidoreductase [Desulfoferrobacter suflitae]MCK8601836.1 molybdopterin-dependent oxidoreductase [Desulfoferrobacter suflitae]
MKDGIIVWETQKTDYPGTGPDLPDYEPRGCPRGATYSWYTYSPVRVKRPYIRSELWRMWKQAVAAHPDPVAAWQSIARDPDQSARYKKARGKGGFVRLSWDEAADLIAAALVDTIPS